MHPEPQLSDRDRILLVRLADGTLDNREAEARLRDIPGGARLLERQRRVRVALREAPGPIVPPAVAVAPAPARRTVARAPARRWAPQVVLAGAVAALALALVVPRLGDRPIVAQAADLSAQPATAGAPVSAGPVLRAGVEGVAFPDWSRKFGWHESGVRHDTLSGRATTTVFYVHMTHRIAYTILPGPPASPPEDARIVRRNGLEIALSHDGDQDIAVFERDGHTCVLAGHVESASTLVELAASHA